LTPKNAADDVWLTEGEGFMTAAEPYEAHLKDATEIAGRKKKRVSLDLSSVVSCEVPVRLLWSDLLNKSVSLGTRVPMFSAR